MFRPARYTDRSRWLSLPGLEPDVYGRARAGSAAARTPPRVCGLVAVASAVHDLRTEQGTGAERTGSGQSWLSTHQAASTPPEFVARCTSMGANRPRPACRHQYSTTPAPAAAITARLETTAAE